MTPGRGETLKYSNKYLQESVPAPSYSSVFVCTTDWCNEFSPVAIPEE